MWVAFNRFYPPELAHVEARATPAPTAHITRPGTASSSPGCWAFIGYIAVCLDFLLELRWLGLLHGRRDNLLFGAPSSRQASAALLAFGNGWLAVAHGRFGLPFGIIAGFGLYTAVAAFLPPANSPTAPICRQMLIITCWRHWQPTTQDPLRHRHRRHAHDPSGSRPCSCSSACASWPSCRQKLSLVAEETARGTRAP